MLLIQVSLCSLKIRMTSHPCNKYEHTMLSYLLIVNQTLFFSFAVATSQDKRHNLLFVHTKNSFRLPLDDT